MAKKKPAKKPMAPPFKAKGGKGSKNAMGGAMKKKGGY